MVRADDLFDALATEGLECGISGIADAIAEEDEDVAGCNLDIELVEGGIVERAKRQAGGLHDLSASRLAVDRPRQARVGNAQSAIRPIPNRIDHGNVLRADGALG